MIHKQYAMTTLAVAAAIVWVCAGCNSAMAPDNDPEAYAVYSAVLPHVWTVQIAQASHYAILHQTASLELKLTPRGESEKKMRGAMQSYERLNGHKWRLQPRFKLDLPYELISTSAFNAEIQRALQQHAELDFDSLYPGAHGVIELSAVGFNRAKTVAVVQMHWLCGSTCGGAEMYVMEKKDGNWAPMSWHGGTQAIRY